MDISPSYKRSLKMSAPLLGVFTLGILGLTTVSAEATLDETDMVGV